MLKNAENIALQNLYTFVLQAEIRTTFGVKVFSAEVMDFVFHVSIKI